MDTVFSNTFTKEEMEAHDAEQPAKVGQKKQRMLGQSMEQDPICSLVPSKNHMDNTEHFMIWIT